MSTAPQISPEPSFRQLYGAHLDYVWRVVRRLGVPSKDADDITQEVFLVVHKKLDEFAGRSSIRTWLYGIAYRVASQYRRRAHVQREVPTECPEASDNHEGEQPALVEQRRARELLDQILGQLDDDKRAVFVFYEIEELSMAEVAEVMDCPLQTAYSRHRAATALVQAAAKRIAAREVV